MSSTSSSSSSSSSLSSSSSAVQIKRVSYLFLIATLTTYLSTHYHASPNSSSSSLSLSFSFLSSHHPHSPSAHSTHSALSNAFKKLRGGAAAGGGGGGGGGGRATRDENNQLDLAGEEQERLGQEGDIGGGDGDGNGDENGDRNGNGNGSITSIINHELSNMKALEDSLDAVIEEAEAQQQKLNLLQQPQYAPSESLDPTPAEPSTESSDESTSLSPIVEKSSFSSSDEASSDLQSPSSHKDSELSVFYSYDPDPHPLYCTSHPSICADAYRDRTMYEKRVARLSSATFSPQYQCSVYQDEPLIEGAEKTEIKLWFDKKIMEWWSHIIRPMMETIDECPVVCNIVTDSPSSADVVVSLMDLFPTVSSSQKTAVISLESFKGHQGHPIDSLTAEKADFLLTYDRRSDIWLNYFYGLTGDVETEKCEGSGDECINQDSGHYFFEKAEENLSKNQNENQAFSALFVSNCVSGRLDYLKELSSYIKIDSYGQCLSNPNLQKDKRSKRLISMEYPFHFAFENWPLDDYVTEKFFEAFSYGVIPVYWGAPNVQDFAPGPKSFINAMDFDSPKELAQELKRIRNDPQEYLSYFEWRKKGISPRFKKMWESNFTNRGKHSWACRLCKKYAQRYCKK